MDSVKFIEKYDISNEIADFANQDNIPNVIYSNIRLSLTEEQAKRAVIAHMNGQIRLCSQVIAKLV